MYSKLPKNDAVAQVLGKQVLRSGTSVGANYREASRSRSKAEFVSKSGDCLKEIEESEYWLELLVDSGCVSAAKMAALLDENRQLIAIFTTSTSARKMAFGLQTSDFRLTAYCNGLIGLPTNSLAKAAPFCD
jgi:four helix bundle protein